MAEKLYTPITPTRTDDSVPMTKPNRPSLVVGMRVRDLLRLLLVGLLIGVVTSGISLLMNRYVFGVVLCRDGGGDCTQAPLYSVIIAVVVGGILGTVFLARLRIFRPMFIVLASAISLWSAHLLVTSLLWYWAIVIAAILYALTYGAFGWIARIRSFILSLILTIVLVVAIRLLLQA